MVPLRRHAKCLISLKATSHLTIFMPGMRTTGKIQRTNYQDQQRGAPFAGRMSSVSVVVYMHARKIAE